MSPTRLIPAAVLALVATAGCAAGMNDATSSEHATPWVANADVGAVQVRAVTLVPSTNATTQAPTPSPTDTTATGTPSPSAADGYLTMTLLSTETDTLTGASLAGGGTVTPGNTTSSLTIRPHQPLVITDPEEPGAPTGGVTLAVTGLQQQLQPGTTVKVTLQFENAGSVTLAAPVRDLAVA